MRTVLFSAVLAVSVVGDAHAQNATVVARAVVREGREPLGFTTVSVLKQGIQRLTTENGTIVLRDLPPGEVGLRGSRSTSCRAKDDRCARRHASRSI